MARKKHSAQKHGRVLGRHAAPLDARRRDEIVEAVVNHLRPWKNHRSRDTITRDVNRCIDVLRKLVLTQEKQFARKPFQEYRKKLDKALRKVEHLLASNKGRFRWHLFATPPTKTTFVPVMSMSRTAFEQFIRSPHTRANAFDMELKLLREACARDAGFHPNYDIAKHRSADFAHGLVELLSDGKISGTEHKAFRLIASLLFEAVSGEQDVDLKRACDEAINASYPYLVGELGTDPSQ